MVQKKKKRQNFADFSSVERDLFEILRKSCSKIPGINFF